MKYVVSGSVRNANWRPTISSGDQPNSPSAESAMNLAKKELDRTARLVEWEARGGEERCVIDQPAEEGDVGDERENSSATSCSNPAMSPAGRRSNPSMEANGRPETSIVQAARASSIGTTAWP